MNGLWQDLKFALRTLRRSPGFTITALATLALGIGVNTAMFSVAHEVLWRSMPYPHPERVVMVGEVDKAKPDSYWGASYPNFKDWQGQAKSFEALAAVEPEQRVLREGTEPARVDVTFASHEFWQVMGVAPEIGRVYGPAEDRRAADPVVVLSHKMWVARFGGDPNIVGRALHFDMGTFTAIGVMPAGFGYDQTDCWLPLDKVVSPWFAAHRNVWVLHSVGRLRAGVASTQAQTEVEGIAQQIRANFPETRRGLVVRVNGIQAELSRDLRPALLVLMGAVGFVLLIACGNLAALMLVRGTARVKEMAIRRALGVGALRLVRQMFTESALLAIAGGAAGVALAYWAAGSIGVLTKDPRLLDVRIDPQVMLFAVAATAATTILFGIAPAIRAARVDANEALKSGARSGTAPEKALAQRALVAAEVALCLVLLVGAGLLLKSFQRVMDVNPGFRTENLVTMQLQLPRSYDSDAKLNAFYLRLEEKLSSTPGATGVTIASQLPITGGEGNGDISIEGRPSRDGELGASTFRNVAPNYFQLMGIPLESGRMFDERDDGSRGRVVIINQGFAKQFWPNDDPIGHRIMIGPRDHNDWKTVVGVAGDVKQIGPDTAAPFSTYEPIGARPDNRFEAAVRTAADPETVIGSLRGELRDLEPAMLVEHVETMSQKMAATVAPRRLNLVLFGVFAGLALLLAAVGLYGVAAFAAGQRTQEFGIRVALGAQRRDVLGMVIVQAMSLALAGIAIGIAAALALARLMQGLLFGVEPTDPLTLCAVALLLGIVTLAACALPAYRATRISPVEALRSE